MNAKYWLEKIHQLKIPNTLRIMNVCGGHERTLSESALRSILPDQIDIIPGPGCPVCVCPEEIIQFAIELSEQSTVILASFGDMLRVPVIKEKKHTDTLLNSRARGNQVVAVASPMEVVQLAQRNSKKTIVFFIAGFETTLAPIVSMLEQGIPDNLKLLIAARKTWPIVNYLLSDSNIEKNNLDALIAPGHVASIMGIQEWNFITQDFHLPCAVAGFSDESLLIAIYSVCRQSIENNIFLDNCYSTVVNNDGNLIAQSLFKKYFSIEDANWRGVGIVPKSGFSLKPQYAAWDATVQYSGLWDEVQQKPSNKKSDMPAGCDCNLVVLGKIKPNHCRLFNKACTPSTPIGPCMVSNEGACHIWWSTGYIKPTSFSSAFDSSSSFTSSPHEQ